MFNSEKRIILLLWIAVVISSCSDTTNPSEDNSHPIKVATWNIQVFGQSKLNDTNAMSIITKVCKNFDIIAIQEIRSIDQNVIPTLLDSLGADWSYVISTRLGRTSSKEQYAFIYKNNVKLIDTFQTLDPLDQIHREPFGATFEIGKIQYTFLNIHTDPDEEETESYYLDTLLRMYNKSILLGDLNRHPNDFDNDYFFEDYNYSLEVNQFTNLLKTKSYDNFIYTKPTFFKGTVYSFQDTFQLSDELAKDVSDHNPVYITIN
ncbi:MAG: endonuclease/exonuclease/phosphatase family protein [Candidatus Kapaibacterium sp.]